MFRSVPARRHRQDRRRKIPMPAYAATEDYEDLVKAGVIDPAKVTRYALQNAASIAGLMLTPEALIAELPDEKGEMAIPGGGVGM